VRYLLKTFKKKKDRIRALYGTMVCEILVNLIKIVITKVVKY